MPIIREGLKMGIRVFERKNIKKRILMRNFKAMIKLLLISAMITVPAFGFKLLNSTKKKESPYSTREMILGGILKGALENMHFTKAKINNDLSSKAFKEFIEKLDYGKQFLLQKDVSQLGNFELKIDDEIASGNLNLLEQAFAILKKRQNYVEKIVFARLKKPFDLKKSRTLQTDPEKRKFSKSLKDLDKLWDNLLAYEVLNRYADYLDEQNGESKDDKSKKKTKKDKKKKKEKKLSHKELEKKARDAVVKSYTRLFKRLKKERRGDKLDKFFNSVAKVYDPHTHYLVPEDKEDFDIDMSGKLEGIGALLREEGSYIKVEKIIPGSASWRGKQLEAGDIILKVGQGEKEAVDVVDMGLRDAVKLIRGKKGSEVRLTVKKASGLSKVIPIIRDVVQIEESYVKSSVLQLKGDKRKYGYIHVPKFYRDFSDRFGRNCTDDTRNALKKIKKKGVDGVILDLRNNGGGALKDAQYISGLFIKEGPIVQVKAHTGSVEILKDTDTSVEFEKPVIVLINRFSASASEIVAAALQDYGRAIIVGGEHSHGKGTVQAVLDLDGYVPPLAKAYSPFGALKITIQKFYRVTGGSTQYKGVTPDIVLPDPFGHMETGERYLDYSLPWAKVDAVKFSPWKKYSYDISKLKKKSEKRISKNQNFSKITDSVKWYKSRKEQSEKKIDLNNFLAERKKLKNEAKKFEIKDPNKGLLVQETDKLKRKEDRERFKEFSEGLQKDPYIVESINILNDILS